MKNTHHSEYGKIKSIYIKPIAEGFVSQQVVTTQWEELNYLDQPNFEDALKEYAQFEKKIKSTGANVSYFKESPDVTMDSIYCIDASFSTDFGIILCHMGKAGKVNEPDACLNIYKEADEKILGRIEAPGTIEGGDVAWINPKTLAIGRTYRTNDNGIKQMKKFLEPHGIRVITVDLPHYKGKSDVFHLMSIFSPVDKDLAVVYSPLMPITFREFLLEHGYEFIEVPEEEFETMGCNVLATAPRECLMVEGNPITKSRLEEAGAILFTYKGKEISVKGGGGPTCLTRPMIREIEG